jgi:hypothetical protein
LAEVHGAFERAILIDERSAPSPSPTDSNHKEDDSGEVKDETTPPDPFEFEAAFEPPPDTIATAAELSTWCEVIFPGEAARREAQASEFERRLEQAAKDLSSTVTEQFLSWDKSFAIFLAHIEDTRKDTLGSFAKRDVQHRLTPLFVREANSELRRAWSEILPHVKKAFESAVDTRARNGRTASRSDSLILRSNPRAGYRRRSQGSFMESGDEIVMVMGALPIPRRRDEVQHSELGDEFSMEPTRPALAWVSILRWVNNAAYP